MAEKLLRVKVIKTPVRYGEKTYRQGEELEINEKYLDKKIFEFIEEVDDGPKELKDMKVDELKEYATEHGIELGDAKRKDDILAAIQSVEDENEDPPQE